MVLNYDDFIYLIERRLKIPSFSRVKNKKKILEYIFNEDYYIEQMPEEFMIKYLKPFCKNEYKYIVKDILLNGVYTEKFIEFLKENNVFYPFSLFKNNKISIKLKEKYKKSIIRIWELNLKYHWNETDNKYFSYRKSTAEKRWEALKKYGKTIPPEIADEYYINDEGVRYLYLDKIENMLEYTEFYQDDYLIKFVNMLQKEGKSLKKAVETVFYSQKPGRKFIEKYKNVFELPELENSAKISLESAKEGTVDKIWEPDYSRNKLPHFVLRLFDVNLNIKDIYELYPGLFDNRYFLNYAMNRSFKKETFEHILFVIERYFEKYPLEFILSIEYFFSDRATLFSFLKENKDRLDLKFIKKIYQKIKEEFGFYKEKADEPANPTEYYQTIYNYLRLSKNLFETVMFKYIKNDIAENDVKELFSTGKLFIAGNFNDYKEDFDRYSGIVDWKSFCGYQDLNIPDENFLKKYQKEIIENVKPFKTLSHPAWFIKMFKTADNKHLILLKNKIKDYIIQIKNYDNFPQSKLKNFFLNPEVYSDIYLFGKLTDVYNTLLSTTWFSLPVKTVEKEISKKKNIKKFITVLKNETDKTGVNIETKKINFLNKLLDITENIDKLLYPAGNKSFKNRVLENITKEKNQPGL